MKVKAYAKINLALDVIGKREDGYHELEMIMAPIILHDLILLLAELKLIQIAKSCPRMNEILCIRLLL